MSQDVRFASSLRSIRQGDCKNDRNRRLINCVISTPGGLAAVQDAPAAAQAFIGILSEPESVANGTQACDVCNEVRAEEDLRIRELATCLHRPDVADWLRTEAVLCIPHANEASTRGAARTRIEDRCYRTELPPATEGTTESVAQRARYGPQRMGSTGTCCRISCFATRITSLKEGKC